MQIWDTAGQERFRSIIPSYIRNSTVAVLVYDITSQTSFSNLSKWKDSICNIANPALVIVGNKVDLEVGREISYEKAETYALSIGAKYIETSARTPININELFNLIAEIPVISLQTDEKKNTEEDQSIKIEKVEITGEKSVPTQGNGGCGC